MVNAVKDGQPCFPSRTYDMAAKSRAQATRGFLGDDEWWVEAAARLE